MAREKEEIHFFVVASYTHTISVCIFFPLCVSLTLIYITAVTNKIKHTKQKKFFFE